MMQDSLLWEPGTTALNVPDVPGMRGIEGRGYYEDEYLRTASGWRISESRLIRSRLEAIGSDGVIALPLPRRQLDPTWLAPHLDRETNA